jgi:hypothetical protein
VPFVLVELFREAPEEFHERVQAAADRRFVEVRFDERSNPPRLVFHVHLSDLIRLQLRQLALQLRELTGHVASLSRALTVSDRNPDAMLTLGRQLESELLDLTASLDRLLDSLPPEIRGEGNGA